MTYLPDNEPERKPISQRYNFIGIDERGNGRTGDVHVSDLAAWVEKNHRRGWARLDVYRVPERATKDGRGGAEWPLVANIGNRDGKRIWWAES